MKLVITEFVLLLVDDKNSDMNIKIYIIMLLINRDLHHDYVPGNYVMKE